MDIFLNQAFIGISIASILLLIALGLAIIYGTMGVINLAHGEFVMLGAYCAWFLQSTFGIGILAALPIVFLVVGFLGFLVERGVVRWLYERPLDTILATWGIGIVIQQLVRMGLGPDSRYVQGPRILEGNIELAGVFMSNYRLFLIVFSISILLATWYLMLRTEYGKKLRAVIQNKEISECYGIPSQKVYALTFAYGAALAGIAGALITPLVSVTPSMGTYLVVDAFLVVILGGIGSFLGTTIAAGLVGEATAMFSFFLNDTLGRVAVLLAIIVIIRFRPEGLFPDKIRK
ncbi:amino acid/amide ABC transporter membrane protein 1, HAAT family [Ectothiorhodosinus mongolicus]|uniref:Amino acid/amide ABC transporter membrane protein 1, HAAT family n=1 Tax=Ectothiorhodosinus mongolicus TaxID=233100 RepID=A0A1R3W4Y3_9GAMM|nr:urea ABC transporter permease subunit UrtB [Ectothiorhodosinus mongolicus]ULX57562.1 urea ABC transporter permease subunit UrtB [Ectothiorhodosinus mongolicus]SIT72813.1 amino acid/amide ABC transporter membrane protein 1, HAAT family [Ectothiorhodosinus mongolicus]